MDLQSSMTTTAKIARKSCPKTVHGYKFFSNFYEINKENDTTTDGNPTNESQFQQ